MHPQEEDIDLFVHAPDSLDVDRRTVIESHLAGCDFCRAMESFFRDFYGVLEKYSGRENSRVEQFLSDLEFRDSIIELFPHRFTPNPAEFGDHVMTVLAAKSEAKNLYRFSSVCTLVSKDEQTLVRILRDNDDEDYRLYLIKDDRVPDLKATVRFPALGISISVQPGSPQTEFKLPANIRDVDWTTIVAELRFSQD